MNLASGMTDALFQVSFSFPGMNINKHQKLKLFCSYSNIQRLVNLSGKPEHQGLNFLQVMRQKFLHAKGCFTVPWLLNSDGAGG